MGYNITYERQKKGAGKEKSVLRTVLAYIFLTINLI